MPRFCATVGPGDPAGDIIRMGGRPVYREGSCALGVLPARESRVQGRGLPVSLNERASGFLQRAGVPAATGDVTLYNRSVIRDILSMSGPVGSEYSDEELLALLYTRSGIDALCAVKGMFSLAVWDGTKLALITDLIGSRSIFHTRIDGYWAASSSLRALRWWLPRGPRVNPGAVRSFLTFGFLPREQTLVQGVDRMPPACCLMLYPDGSSELTNYWEPAEGPWDPTDPPEAYAEALRDLLEEATRSCLPSNQEVGVFLSGGLDSSLVTALAAQVHDGPVRTYTIHFGADEPNELYYANLVAAHCETEHQVLAFTGEEVGAHVLETAAIMDCPVGEGLTVPNLLLSRAAAKDGLRIVLNGEGGDPLFGGPKNLPMLIFELQRRDPDPSARAQAYLRAYRHFYDDLGSILTREFQQASAHEAPMESIVQPYLESPRMRYYVNRLMWLNLRLKGPGFMLAKVESIPRWCGLEGRYPLFDRNVVEYAFRVPPSYKLRGTVEKYVLKEAVKDLLPEPVLSRPKSGMRMPMRSWLKGPLNKLARSLLFDARGRDRGIFQLDVIDGWMNEKGLLWRRHGQRLWMAIMLEAWLRTWIDTAEFVPAEPRARRWWRIFPFSM